MKSAPRSGFTIVELLVVIIVIGILAAIGLVAYNGAITNSKSESAHSSAALVQKKLESYYSAKGSYPTATDVGGYTAALNSLPQSTLDGTDTSIAADLSPTNGQKSVQISQCTAPSITAAATAYRIRYWNFNKSNYADTVDPTDVITGNASDTACTTWDPLN